MTLTPECPASEYPAHLADGFSYEGQVLYMPHCALPEPCSTGAHCEHCCCPRCNVERGGYARALWGNWWTDPAEFTLTGEPRPAILTRADGATLAYRGCTNWFYGERGSGKTFTAMIAAIRAVNSGRRVAYWELEDSPQSFGERAALLGGFDAICDTTRFRHFQDDILYDYGDGTRAERLNLEAAIEWLGDGDLYIDTAAGANAPQDGDDVRPWIAAYVTPWRKRGATVTVLDHVPKQRKDRPAGPIGSERKLSGIDGAGLKFVGKPWNRTTGGQFSIVLERDKHGQLPGTRDDTIATVRGTYDHNGAFAYTIEAPDTTAPPATSTTATVAIGKIRGEIAALLTDEPGLARSAIADRVPRRRQHVLQVLDMMVSDGEVTRDDDGRWPRFTLTDPP